MVTGREGYTLVEAIISTVLGGVLLVLVLSVLQTQTDFYHLLEDRIDRDQGTRDAAMLTAREIRSALDAGVTVAEPGRLVFRRPMVVTTPCAFTSSGSYLLFPLGGSPIDTASVSGYATRSSTGAWTYTDADYSSLDISFPASAAGACADAGSDTAGAASDFGYVPSSLSRGSLYMLYQAVELRLATSVLDSSTLALFRGEPGGTLAEMVSGLGAGTAFEYHLNTGVYRSSVTGTDLALIDGIRVTVAYPDIPGRATPPPISVDIPLANAD